MRRREIAKKGREIDILDRRVEEGVEICGYGVAGSSKTGVEVRAIRGTSIGRVGDATPVVVASIARPQDIQVQQPAFVTHKDVISFQPLIRVVSVGAVASGDANVIVEAVSLADGGSLMGSESITSSSFSRPPHRLLEAVHAGNAVSNAS